ncbi:MAG: type II CAAX endopeptidase family protein [Lagierella massiliensis]|nr:type II CAAX endopeptidase family protein [Lagierella massiliensis]
MILKENSKVKVISFSIFTVIFYDLFFMFYFGIITHFIGDKNFLDENYLFLDTIACLILLPIYTYLYKRKTFKLNLMGNMSTIKFVLITLGSIGFSTIWVIGFNYISEKITFLNEIYNNFNETWSDILKEDYIWILLSVVILGPIVEELLFRGIIINTLNNTFSRKTAILISAVIFGIWHKDLIQMVYTIFFGIVLGVVYSRTNNIKYPIYMHILNNFLNSLPDFEIFYNIYFYINIISIILIIPSVILIYKKGKNELSLNDFDEICDNSQLIQNRD